MLTVTRLYRLSYEQTEYQVRDSLGLRQFCQVYLNEVPDDTTLLRWAGLIQPDTLEQHQQRFGHPPYQASGGRGVHSPENELIAREKGVQRIILPLSDYKSQERKEHEKKPWFRRGRNWHVGVEGRISVLKRRFGLDRCWEHGQAHFE